MILLRRSPPWTALLRNHSAKTTRNSIGSRTWQQSLRRSYASEGGHGTKEASSDLPWLVGAIVVTVPSCYYILKPELNKTHGHGHGEGDHKEHEEHEEGEEHDEASGEEEAKTGDSAGEEAEEKEDGDEGTSQPAEGESKDAETSGDSESDKGATQDTPETSDDDEPKNVAHVTEGGGNVEGVQFKGATKGGTRDGEQGDTRKHIPDAKGFNKKRIESDYGNRLGVADEESKENIDTPASSKPSGSMSWSQSGKQEGLSNTDTKHSTDITNNPEKSKKPEGTPETSKSKGTVPLKRPEA